MVKKIFIGSFPLNTPEQTLKDLFSPHGQIISFTLIRDHVTGSSRGFGFVEMATDEAALSAIQKLNGF